MSRDTLRLQAAALDARELARSLGIAREAIPPYVRAATLFTVIGWLGHASDCDRDAERLRRLFPDQ